MGGKLLGRETGKKTSRKVGSKEPSKKLQKGRESRTDRSHTDWGGREQGNAAGSQLIGKGSWVRVVHSTEPRGETIPCFVRSKGGREVFENMSKITRHRIRGWKRTKDEIKTSFLSGGHNRGSHYTATLPLLTTF